LAEKKVLVRVDGKIFHVDKDEGIAVLVDEKVGEGDIGD
jgi:hypothetical protein